MTESKIENEEEEGGAGLGIKIMFSILGLSRIMNLWDILVQIVGIQSILTFPSSNKVLFLLYLGKIESSSVICVFFFKLKFCWCL